MDSAGIRIAHVKAPAAHRPTLVEPDGQWGSDLPLRNIVDARVLEGGRIGFLDGPSGNLWIVDPRTGSSFAIGKRGSGLGESATPSGFVAVAEGFGIWDTGRRRLDVFDDRGTFAFTTEHHDSGDFASIQWREERLIIDVASRLRGDHQGLWLRLEDSEHVLASRDGRGPREVRRRGYIVRIDPDRGVALTDTVMIYDAVPRMVDPGGPSFTEAMFMPDVVWDARGSVIAHARTDAAEVRLHDEEGRLRNILRWPAAKSATTLSMKREHARSYVREHPDLFPPEALAPENAAMLHGMADQVRFAPFAPELTSIRLSGGCVWVAGFEPGTAADGVGRAWSYYTVDGEHGGAVVFGSVSARVMDIGFGYAVAKVITEPLGIQQVLRYRLPEDVVARCDGP